MKNTKKIFALSLTMLLLFTGCGGGSQESSSSEESSSVESIVSSDGNNSSQEEPSEEITLEKIMMASYPKTQYTLGESLSLEGAKIKLVYSDGNKEEINITIDMVTLPDMTTAGSEKEVLVTYLEKTTSFYIDVIGGELKTPTLTFSIENGAKYFAGDVEGLSAITASVEENVQYSVWFEQNEVNIGTTVPTEIGTYAIVIETMADSQYESVKDYRWFEIVANKTSVIVTFSEETTFTYDGTGKTPTIVSFTDKEGNPLTLTNEDYSIQYEQNEVLYSDEAPIEVGTYAMVVKFNEEGNYQSAYVHATRENPHWITFTINPAPSVDQKIVDPVFENQTPYTYDGQPHSPVFVGFVDGEGNTVEIPETEYTIHYSSETTGYYSSEAPTEVAYYGMVITFNDTTKYIFSNGKAWNQAVFQIAAVE